MQCVHHSSLSSDVPIMFLNLRVFLFVAMRSPRRPRCYELSAAFALAVLLIMLDQTAITAARVTVGAEAFVEANYTQLLPGQGKKRIARVAVVADPTSVLPGTAEHLVDRMHRDGFGSERMQLVVYGPEHGFRGDQQAGSGGSSESYVDNRTGFTVYNCYGLNRSGLASLIRKSHVDAIVFDIQDVGARFYTFIWTMYDLLGAASDVTFERDRILSETIGEDAKLSFPFIVLDRPNPLSGTQVRGPMNPTHTSFVGRANIPLMHGLTVGELARLFQGEFLEPESRAVNVAVVRMQGWVRTMSWEQTGLPWIIASPNMPTLDTVRVYPGMCLLEGTTMSEGRGTTRPFNMVGAPYLGWEFSAALREKTRLRQNRGDDIRAYLYREAFFTPTFSKWAGNTSGGVDIVLMPLDTLGSSKGDEENHSERMTLEPMEIALEVLSTAHEQTEPRQGSSSGSFGWLSGGEHVDLLTGSNYTRLAIDQGIPVADIMREHAEELSRSGFTDRVRPKYMLPEYEPRKA